MISNITKLVKRKHEPQSLARAMCVLAVYNKAQARRMSNREFKLWTILHGTVSGVATFHAETCVTSHQSLNGQATKSESPIAVELGSRTPKSDHGIFENV